MSQNSRKLIGGKRKQLYSPSIDLPPPKISIIDKFVNQTKTSNAENGLHNSYQSENSSSEEKSFVLLWKTCNIAKPRRNRSSLLEKTANKSNAQQSQKTIVLSDSFDSMLYTFLTPPNNTSTSSQSSNRKQDDMTFDEILNVLLTPEVSAPIKSTFSVKESQPSGQTTERKQSSKLNVINSIPDNLRKQNHLTKREDTLQVRSQMFLDAMNANQMSRIYEQKSNPLAPKPQEDLESRERFRQLMRKVLVPNLDSSEASHSGSSNINDLNYCDSSERNYTNISRAVVENAQNRSSENSKSKKSSQENISLNVIADLDIEEAARDQNYLVSQIETNTNSGSLNRTNNRERLQIPLGTIDEMTHQIRHSTGNLSEICDNQLFSKNIVSEHLLDSIEINTSPEGEDESHFKEISTQTSFNEGCPNQNVIPVVGQGNVIPPYRYTLSADTTECILCCGPIQEENTATDVISSNSTGICREEKKISIREHMLEILSRDIVELSDGRKVFNNISKVGTDKWLMSALRYCRSINNSKFDKNVKIVNIVESENVCDIYIDYCTNIQLKRYTKGTVKICQIKKTRAITYTNDSVEDYVDYEACSRKDNTMVDTESKLELSVDEICNNPDLIWKDYPIQEVDKSKIRVKIHSIFAKLYQAFENNEMPNLVYKRHERFNDCVFTNNRLQCGARLKNNNPRCKPSRFRFYCILYVMGKVYELLQTDKKLTKREMFYQIKHVIKREGRLTAIINQVTQLLGVGQWHLNLICHSGVVFGNMKLIWSSGEVTNCNLPATLIPYDLENLVEIQSNASFILVVEKESIFRKLLEEDLANKLARPFVMISGKGQPDTNTRLFLNRISRILAIPVFILADADVYGIRIMLTYRFGSIINCQVSNDLVVPHARWLGVFPSDIIKYGMKHQMLTERDKKEISTLLKYPYMEQYPRIATELELLLISNKKASIEGVMKNNAFLSDSYLPTKFINKDFV